jgi:hypothetical protein
MQEPRRAAESSSPLPHTTPRRASPARPPAALQPDQFENYAVLQCLPPGAIRISPSPPSAAPGAGDMQFAAQRMMEAVPERARGDLPYVGRPDAALRWRFGPDVFEGGSVASMVAAAFVAYLPPGAAAAAVAALRDAAAPPGERTEALLLLAGLLRSAQHPGGRLCARLLGCALLSAGPMAVTLWL